MVNIVAMVLGCTGSLVVGLAMGAFLLAPAVDGLFTKQETGTKYETLKETPKDAGGLLKGLKESLPQVSLENERRSNKAEHEAWGAPNKGYDSSQEPVVKFPSKRNEYLTDEGGRPKTEQREDDVAKNLEEARVYLEQALGQ